MKPILLALLLAAACKHSTSSSSTEHTETSTTTESTSSETGNTTTVTTTSEAPGKTVTVVEEYAPPDSSDRQDAPVGDESAKPPADAGLGTTAGRSIPRPDHGPLTRRTVTTTTKGAETTETHQQAVTQGTAAITENVQATTDAKAKAKDEGGPSVGCIGASWFWGLAALAFAGLLIFGAIRMRRAVP